VAEDQLISGNVYTDLHSRVWLMRFTWPQIHLPWKYI